MVWRRPKETEEEENVGWRCNTIDSRGGKTFEYWSFYCSEEDSVKILKVGRWVAHALSEQNTAECISTSITGILHLYYELLDSGETVNSVAVNNCI